MKLAEKVLVEDAEAEEGEEGRAVKNVPDWKTKSQKNKAQRLLAEVCSILCPSTTLIFVFVETRADDGIHKQRKDLARSTARLLSEREKKHLERLLALEEKMKTRGLAGQKLVKHKIPQGELEVQHGEDLSERASGG